jgi:phosphoserine phosphatase
MVRLAKPLVPNYLEKFMLREPLNAHKVVRFSWDLAKLWTLRTVYREHRKRYKHLFSELHHLAAAVLQDTPLEVLRKRYRKRTAHLASLWHSAAGDLLRKLTGDGMVVLVTGSEQLQTEECVRRLQPRGVDLSRVFIRGSLYHVDHVAGRFTGSVRHLNVTLESKRDAVRDIVQDTGYRVRGAIGNSRPDRALFEAVVPQGVCALVCAQSVIRRRKSNTFVIRKLQRCGYAIAWDAPSYLAALRDYAAGMPDRPRPLLMTDDTFHDVLLSLTAAEDRSGSHPAGHSAAPA